MEQKVTIHGNKIKIPYYSLNLSSKNIKDIEEIKGLHNLNNLENLGLSSNEIKEIKSLENLTSLTLLDLSFNQISEIKGLDSLINLKNLRLSLNRYSKIKGLEKLTNLERLTLDLSEDMKLEGLGSLENLNFLAFNYDSKFQDLFVDLGGIDSEHGVINEPQKIVEYCKKSKTLSNLDFTDGLKGVDLIIVKELAQNGNLKAFDILKSSLHKSIQEERDDIVRFYFPNEEIEKIFKKNIPIQIIKRGIEFIDKLFKTLTDTYNDDYLSSFSHYFKDVDGNVDKCIQWKVLDIQKIVEFYCFFEYDLIDDWEYPNHSPNENRYYSLLWQILRSHLYYDFKFIGKELIMDLISIIKNPGKFYDVSCMVGGSVTKESDFREVVPELFAKSGFNDDVLKPVFKIIFDDSHLKDVFIREIQKLHNKKDYSLYFLTYLVKILMPEEIFRSLIDETNLNLTLHLEEHNQMKNYKERHKE